MDRRRLFANARVADLSLAGQHDAPRFAQAEEMQVSVPVANLRDAPEGARDRQLLLGASVDVLEERDGWCFVRAADDGYVGYVERSDLDFPRDATHFISAAASHAYARADMKSPDLLALSFGSRMRVTDERKKFFETPQGFIHKGHLRPLDRELKDPVTVAQLHFGTPYLWGGNSIWGIDCSGLVQVACRACGMACPGDSDMQEAELGEALDVDAELQRGDLVFWKGHVGMMVDEETLIHANAHHMAVAYEPISKAMRRIEVQGDGPVTGRRRIG